MTIHGTMSPLKASIYGNIAFMLFVLSLSLALNQAPIESAFPVNTVTNASRVERFAGAFIGGLAGLAASAAILPLTETCGFSPCTGSVFVLFFAPLLMSAGSSAGFSIMGGSAGFATSMGGLSLGLGLSSLVYLLGRANGQSTNAQLAPYLLGGMLMANAIAAAAMVFREESVIIDGDIDFSASAARVAVSALVNTLAIASSAFLTVGAIALAGSGPAILPVAFSVTALLVLATAATDFAIHRAMGGKGTFWAALGGVLVAGILAILPAFAFSSSFGSTTLASNSGIVNALIAGGLAGVFLPTLFLEMHDTAVRRQKISVGIAPIQQGGMVSASLQF
jgi:hypothetical protein